MKRKILAIILVIFVIIGVRYVYPEYELYRKGKVEVGKNMFESKKAYVAPELVDEKADLKEDKQKFLDSLNKVLPPKIILESLGSGVYEFTLELYINGDGKLGSFKIEGEDMKISEQLRDIIYSKRFEDFLNDLQYKPAKIDGQTIGSTIPLKLLISVDKNGKVVAPWYVYSSAENRKGIKPLNIMQKTEFKTSLQEMPKYPGGNDKLMSDLLSRIVYPESAKRAGVQGKVLVAVFVDETGSVVSAEVLKDVGAGLGEAALDAVKDLQFIPGKENGKPAKARMVMPFSFKLQ